MEKFKEQMKNIGIFFLLCFYVVGTIGGLGVTLYAGSYFIAACVAALSGMAFPTAKTFFKKMIGEVKIKKD